MSTTAITVSTQTRPANSQIIRRLPGGGGAGGPGGQAGGNGPPGAGAMGALVGVCRVGS
ncbi:hypothetical protein [Mycobacterium sp. pW045]|uniref:hypothetical protein n=1 Tax=Mycobacterium sp. pW045 TaxID=3238984 RepID=UPI00351B5A3B